MLDILGGFTLNYMWKQKSYYSNDWLSILVSLLQLQWLIQHIQQVCTFSVGCICLAPVFLYSGTVLQGLKYSDEKTCW